MTRKRVRRRKAVETKPTESKKRRRVRRRKTKPKTKKRVRRRKTQLTHDELIRVVELLIDDKPKKRRRKAKPKRRKKVKGDVPITAANTQQIDVQNSGYSNAVAKEAAATEFAAKTIRLKEHETEVALNRAELARLQIENGHSETAKEIVAYHKARGVHKTSAEALEDIKKIGELENEGNRLRGQNSQLKQDVKDAKKAHDDFIRFANTEHERIKTLHDDEQEQMGLVSATLDAKATESERRATLADNKRLAAELAAASSEKEKQEAQAAIDVAKVSAREREYQDSVRDINEGNERALREWYADTVRVKDLKTFIESHNKKNPNNTIKASGTKRELFDNAATIGGFAAAFQRPKPKPDPPRPADLPEPKSPAVDQVKTRLTDEELDALSVDFSGAGKGKLSGRGLTDREINRIMRKKPRYVGCFAADEMADIPTKSTFGFVINTQPREVEHGHWVACYVDTKRDKAIEYYDPFGKDPEELFMRDLKGMVDGLDSRDYLKLKINRIKAQDAASDTCGWHSMNFLLERFKGKPFRQVSGFDDSIKGEKDAEKLKKKYTTYGYI